MITPPSGWIVERTADGLLLAPPDGPERAIVHYAERRRPIRRALDLVRAAQVPHGFVLAATSAPRRLVTIEGEHAALVTRTGTIGGAAVVLAYGFVFLDDYYAVVEAIVKADAPHALDVVEQLVVGDVHLLGRQRRRRFIYEPPAGWQGTGDVFAARWYPLDYPKNPARIFVNPALPAATGLVTGILDGLGFAPGEPIARFTTRHGLAGEHHRRDDVHVFFLGDELFLYGVRADRDADAGRALVESIEPVPNVRIADVGALRFWAD